MQKMVQIFFWSNKFRYSDTLLARTGSRHSLSLVAGTYVCALKAEDGVILRFTRLGFLTGAGLAAGHHFKSHSRLGSMSTIQPYISMLKQGFKVWRLAPHLADLIHKFPSWGTDWSVAI